MRQSTGTLGVRLTKEGQEAQARHVGFPVWWWIDGPQAQRTACLRQVAAAGHVTQAVRACGTTTSALLTLLE